MDRANYVYQNNDSILELVKEAPKECYVTLFIPLDKRELAEKYLPSGVSDRIFAPYGGKISRVTTQDVYNGDIEAIFGNVIRKWSSVMLNSGTGSVYYDTSLRPQKLVRGNGGILNSSNERFSPMFGHNNNLYNYDCSSLITMILCDCGVFRNDVNTVTAFTSSTWATTAIEEINSKLKEDYKAIFMDIDQNTQICTGDILIITLQERLKMGENRNFGHAALAVV